MPLSKQHTKLSVALYAGLIAFSSMFLLRSHLALADVNFSTSISVSPGYASDNSQSYAFSNGNPSQPFFGANATGTYANSAGSYPYYYGLYSDLSFCSNSNCTAPGDPIFQLPPNNPPNYEEEVCSSGGGTTPVGYSATSTGFYLPSTFYIVAGAHTYCNGTNFSISAINLQTSGSSGGGIFSFVTPANGGTTDDFTDWLIEYPSSSVPGSLQVVYSPASGYAGTNGTDTASFSSFVNVNPLPILKSQSLIYPLLVPPILYNATATLYDSSGTVQFVATTTFYITDVAGTMPTSTASICGAAPPAFFGITSTLPYFYVGNPLPYIGYGICGSLTFLFIPNSGGIAQIQSTASGIGGILSTKPPFGYFTAAISDMGSFNVATSSTSTILDATSSAELSGFTHPLDQGVALIVGFMLLLWFFNRGRHFEPT